MKFNAEAEKIIDKLYRGHVHVELTIGILRDGMIWHGGSAGAYSGFLGFYPEKGTAVFTAVNYGLADAEPLGFAILKEV